MTVMKWLAVKFSFAEAMEDRSVESVSGKQVCSGEDFLHRKTGGMGTLKNDVKPVCASSYKQLTVQEGRLFAWFFGHFWGCFLSVF
jgi:hypothetical protein